MPKFTSIYDQGKMRYADRVIGQNLQNESDLPKLEDTGTLGREWRYYKKDIEKARRVRKKQNEREANNRGGGGRMGSSYGPRGGGGHDDRRPMRSGGQGRPGIGQKRNRPWGE